MPPQRRTLSGAAALTRRCLSTGLTLLAIHLWRLAVCAGHGTSNQDCGGLEPPVVQYEQLFLYGCESHKRVCLDQSTLIFWHKAYAINNPERQRVPDIGFARLFDWPAPGDSNVDAVRPSIQKYTLFARAASAVEPTPDLVQPRFTACQVPMLILQPWVYNMAEFVANTAAPLHRMLQQGVIDRQLTLTLATPFGMASSPFHHALMAPISDRPLATLAELSARATPGRKTTRCFKRIVVCRFHFADDYIVLAGQAAAAHMEAAAAGQAAGPAAALRNPLAFSDDGWAREEQAAEAWRLLQLKQQLQLRPTPLQQPTSSALQQQDHHQQQQLTAGAEQQAEEQQLQGRQQVLVAGHGAPQLAVLRVLIESRHGPVRNIKNMDELLAACKRLTQQGAAGFNVGRFRGIECRAFSFSPPPRATPAHKRQQGGQQQQQQQHHNISHDQQPQEWNRPAAEEELVDNGSTARRLLGQDSRQQVLRGLGRSTARVRAAAPLGMQRQQQQQLLQRTARALAQDGRDGVLGDDYASAAEEGGADFYAAAGEGGAGQAAAATTRPSVKVGHPVGVAAGGVDTLQFASNIAAVRSADVLVVVHGAGGANAYYMRPGSALLEVRPCRFGTTFHAWPDKYFMRTLSEGDDEVQFYAFNVEDPQQCIPGDWEGAVLHARAARANSAHKSARALPPGTSSAQLAMAPLVVDTKADMWARDQHLELAWPPLEAMLRHVAGALYDKRAYKRLRKEDLIKGYVHPGPTFNMSAPKRSTKQSRV